MKSRSISVKKLITLLILVQIACTLATPGTSTSAAPRPVQIAAATSEPHCLRAQTTLHVRVAPDPKSRVLFLLYQDRTAEIIPPTVTDWTHIQTGQGTGYVRTRYTAPEQCP